MTSNPPCPRCGSESIPVVHGKPGPALVEATRAGRVYNAGCRVPESPPQWRCLGRRHHQWRTDDDPGWLAAVEAAVSAHR